MLLLFLIRLNRTMQYGNSSGEGQELRQSRKFKSYYVVWKLFASVQASTKTAGFKSYYVVWKPFELVSHHHPSRRLNRTMQYGNHPVADIFLFHRYRLNRTMQYGNLFWGFWLQFLVCCLNRTMQYGNCKRIEKYENLEQSLNRTMQYGNQSKFFVLFIIIHV